MPSASANMSAKFIDQIDTSNRWVIRKRLPAEAISPRIVRSSGRPAATSEPNARSRIASVTGQEMISDFSIALLFASLKSDHMPGAPVRLTVVVPLDSSASSPSGRPRRAPSRWARGRAAAQHHRAAVLGDLGGDARHAAVRLEDACGLGDGGVEVAVAVDDDHERVAALALERGVDRLAGGDGLGPRRLPPGPGARSARGASAPRPTATTAQTRTTSRTCPAAQRPRRPIGPTLVIGSPRGKSTACVRG